MPDFTHGFTGGRRSSHDLAAHQLTQREPQNSLALQARPLAVDSDAPPFTFRARFFFVLTRVAARRPAGRTTSAHRNSAARHRRGRRYFIDEPMGR